MKIREIDRSLEAAAAEVGDRFTHPANSEFDRTIRKIWIALHDRSPNRARAAVEHWFAIRLATRVPRVDELGIDGETIHVLETAGIETIQELCNCSVVDLLAIGRIRESRVQEIEIALEARGLRLARRKCS